MLVRLMYASRATETVRSEVLNAILRKSTHNNPAAGAPSTKRATPGSSS